MKKKNNVEQYVLESAIIRALSDSPKKEEEILDNLKQNQIATMIPDFDRKFTTAIKKVAYEVEIKINGENEIGWKLKRPHRRLG